MLFEQKTGGCCSARTLVAAPVVGVIIAALAYYYYDSHYTRFVKVNFDDWVLYTNNALFAPKDERYLLVFYSSNVPEQEQFLKALPRSVDAVIVAIDFAQNRDLVSTSDIIYVTSGINTLLHYTQHFRIRHVPTIVEVYKQKNTHAFYQSAPLQEISSSDMMRLAAQK